MKKLSLQEVLEGIEDTRRERSVWYPLHEVLFIMLAVVICGATSYVKVELFGKIVCECSYFWEKKVKKAEKASETGKRNTRCLHISDHHQGNRYPAAARSVCGVDDKCRGAGHQGGGDRWKAGPKDQGRKEKAASCGERIFSGVRTGAGAADV